MPVALFSALPRLVLVVFLAIVPLSPALAQVTIFSPFNLPGAVDGNVKGSCDIFNVSRVPSATHRTPRAPSPSIW